MREWLRAHRAKSVLLAGLLVSGTALAFPWDIDMVNGAALKAYEWVMADATPGRTVAIEVNGGRVWSGGSVQRPTARDAKAADGGPVASIAYSRPMANGAYQDDFVASTTYAASADLTNPYTVDAKLLALGETRYGQACATCHGMDGAGVGPVTWHDPAKGRDRFKYAAATLFGEKSVLNAKKLTDGQVYNRIRNGFWVSETEMHMPGYGAALSDKERWAVTAFLRHKSPAPAPVAEPAPAADAATPTEGNK